MCVCVARSRTICSNIIIINIIIGSILRGSAGGGSRFCGLEPSAVVPRS